MSARGYATSRLFCRLRAPLRLDFNYSSHSRQAHHNFGRTPPLLPPFRSAISAGARRPYRVVLAGEPPCGRLASQYGAGRLFGVAGIRSQRSRMPATPPAPLAWLRSTPVALATYRPTSRCSGSPRLHGSLRCALLTALALKPSPRVRCHCATRSRKLPEKSLLSILGASSPLRWMAPFYYSMCSQLCAKGAWPTVRPSLWGPRPIAPASWGPRPYSFTPAPKVAAAPRWPRLRESGSRLKAALFCRLTRTQPSTALFRSAHGFASPSPAPAPKSRGRVAGACAPCVLPIGRPPRRFGLGALPRCLIESVGGLPK